MNNTNNEVPLSSKCFTILAALFMVGDVYVVPHLTFLSWGLLLFVVATPYFATKIHRSRYLNKQYLPVLIFCIYSLAVSLFSIVIISNSARDILVRVIRESFFYIIIFIFGSRLFNYDLFRKTISKIIIILAAFVILQALIYYTTGYFIPGLIPNVQINDAGLTGKQMYDALLRYARYHGFIKVNGFLCEPAHCAHYFFICLLVLLFDSDESDKYSFVKAVFISVAMIATMSTNAFLELIIAWFSWLIVEKKKRILQITVLALSVILGFLVISSRGDISNFSFVFNRFAGIFGSDDVSMTASMRVLKGFDIFKSLNPFNKIFGIGFGAYNAAAINGIFNVGSYDIQNEYMSSLWYLLISSGIIGITLYLSYFISIFRSKDTLRRILIVSIIILSFGTSLYCSAIYVWMMLIINDQNRCRPL